MKNNVTPAISRECLLSQNFRHAMPVYLDDNGEKTTDIKKARFDVYGRPVVVEHSKDAFIPHKHLTPCEPISFNPRDPQAVERAVLLRDAFSMGTMASPVDYTDKFAAIKFANNSAAAFEQNFKNTVQSLDVTHVEPAPVVETSKEIPKDK